MNPVDKEVKESRSVTRRKAAQKKGEPSAQDLDTVAAEQQVKDATAESQTGGEVSAAELEAGEQWPSAGNRELTKCERLELRVADLEKTVNDLVARIAHFNERSAHKL